MDELDWICGWFMPFGLFNVGTSFSRLMEMYLEDQQMSHLDYVYVLANSIR